MLLPFFLLSWALGCLSLSSQACTGNATAEDVLSGYDFSGRTAIVTGGDTGLGYAISQSLLKHGASVVIASRNEEKGLASVQRLHGGSDGRVEWMHLDLGSLAAVRAFGQAYLAKYGNTLHLLINNAGIDHPSFETADGFESVFEIDYLGHFFLTELLLPILRSSSPSRVINVASGSHAGACTAAGLPNNCFADWSYLPPPVISGGSSYGIAKFAQIQHAAALARREVASGVVAVSLTPGFARTSMTASTDPKEAASICLGPDMAVKMAHECPFSPEEATAVVAWCAVSKLKSGLYYSRVLDCASDKVDMQGFTESMQDELYLRSLKWVGLTPTEFVTVYE